MLSSTLFVVFFMSLSPRGILERNYVHLVPKVEPVYLTEALPFYSPLYFQSLHYIWQLSLLFRRKQSLVSTACHIQKI